MKEWVKLKSDPTCFSRGDQKLMNDKKFTFASDDDLELWFEDFKRGHYPAKCIFVDLNKKIEKTERKKYKNQVVDFYTEYVNGRIAMGNFTDKHTDINNNIMMSHGKRYSELFEL